jgi:hypothetical protein
MASAANIVETKNKAGITYVTINLKTKKGSYRILPKPGQRNSQYEFCEEIKFEGFSKLPTGFYKNDGNGLVGGGFQLLKALHEHFGKKVELRLVAKGEAVINARGTKVKVALPHSELKTLNAKVREIKQIKNEEIRSTIHVFLARKFPKRFPKSSRGKNKYIPGSLASALERADAITRMNPIDRQYLEKLIPSYLSNIKATLSAPEKLKIIYESLDAGKVVYFKKVIREFRRRLKKPSQSESDWQTFLSEHILVLKSGYGHVLKKNSVTLQGKFPDFMLIDPYGYLDIYEIKKPATSVLKHDKSRDNYYWDIEIARAISQVENYLHQVQRNSDGLINDIRRNKKIEINIVRPRGYIIAGKRDQLQNQKMIDDFRILNEALKNVDIIFYDDLVENLETFVKRIGN